MSNEIVQPTEQHLSRSTSTQGGKASKPPALDASSFINTPQPSSSSTHAASTAQNTATTEDSDTTALSGSPFENDSLKAADEALEVPKKTRSLLHVPSRSSSQNIQPSPTSTGLSGATVSDSRESIGSRSKGSKGSTLGRRRNGSVASSRMSITQQGVPAGQPGAANTSSHPAAARQAKKKGFLSFLCCGVPDGANSMDPHDAAVPANKVTKAPSTRPITASRPDQGTSTHSNSTPSKSTTEKEAFRQDAVKQVELDDGFNANTSGRNSQTGTSTLPEVNGDVNESHAVARDISLPELSEAADPTSAEQTVVSSPAAASQGLSRSGSRDVSAPEVQEQKDPEDDMITADSQPVPADKEEALVPVVRQDEPLKEATLPPPPVPQPQAGPTDSLSEPEPAEEKQEWLLPPIAPRFQGKKCLVLDLDETLVHSSFKILHQADFTIPVEIEGQYHNVYVIKRPGVDQFMKRVGELYEVVVFTASVSKYGDPLLDQLDIHHVVHHRLFRESCYNHQGNYVKDLSQVGRDLRETIIIDNSPTSYIFHPQHAVPISSWFSDAHDNELLDLIPVLEDLAGPQVRDVSLVLDVAL
ncbi:hypothetical protein PZA11_005829 [Diplocarpon coronariae]